MPSVATSEPAPRLRPMNTDRAVGLLITVVVVIILIVFLSRYL